MKILLSGYYGFDNTGDEAILETVKANLYKYLPGCSIDVLSANNRFNLSAIRDCDLFISGGGGLLQDATSSRSFYYYLGLIFLAQLAGKKTCILSQSIGPVKSSFNRLLLKKVLSRVNLITVRDQSSVGLLKEIGLPADKIIRTADPCFLMDAPRHRTLDIGRRTICVSLRDWHFNGTQKKQFADLLVKIKNEFNADVLLIPFQYKNDLMIAQEIAELTNNQVVALESRRIPEELLKIIGSMDLVIGMRLHSLIFAMLSNVPVVGISYDPKVSSMLEEAKLPFVEASGLDMKLLYQKIKQVFSKGEDSNLRLQGLDRFKGLAGRAFELIASEANKIKSGI